MPRVERKWTIDGTPLLHPAVTEQYARDHGWPLEWVGLCNSIRVPRGREAGTAHLLVRESAAALGAGEHTIAVEHEDGTLSSAGWILERAIAISKTPQNATHWVTLRDRRWVWEQTACGDRRYNLRKTTGSGASAYVTDSLNGGAPWTWQEIVTDLWGLLPGGGTAPTLPYTPGSTPENLGFDGASAWDALCRVLGAIGCVVVWDHTADTYSIVRASAAVTRPDYSDRLIYRWACQPAPKAKPASVEVQFQRLPEESDSDWKPWWQQPYTETAAVGGSGGTWPIADTMFGFTANSAERTARAAELADAVNGYFDPQANPWAETYSGVVPLVCSARVTSVLVQAVGRSGTLTQGEYQGAGLTLPDMLPYTDTGGGGSKIMYSIDSTTTHGSASPYNGLVVATVTVIVAPCDRSELIDTQVEVVDHSGCLFDEPANDLVGRIGWAFEGIAKSRASGAAPGELTPCHWAADGLCCPTGV